MKGRVKDPYSIEFEEFEKLHPWNFHRVADTIALNRRIAEEVTSSAKTARQAGRQLMVICPVGPLDYSYWAEELNRAQIDGSSIVTINMDEYLKSSGVESVEESHPLSFRGFMQRELFDRLMGKAKIPPENIHFPSPEDPERTTRLIEEHGGADLCYGGLGLTGHFAFNDPPEPGETLTDEDVKSSRTRTLTICRESMAQMCMGGTGGNWDILPKRAVTLGMYELLLSRKIHLTFMRSWHAGVLRRALFGPVSRDCPGSFIQEHSNVEVSLTEIAAQLPLVHVAQRIGE